MGEHFQLLVRNGTCRRLGQSRGAGPTWPPGRPDRRHRTSRRCHGRRGDRRQRDDRGPGHHRPAHPLRPPDHLGPLRDRLVLPRGDHGAGRQLRVLGGADPPGRPAVLRRALRQGRGHGAGGPRRHPLGVRDLPGIPGQPGRAGSGSTWPVTSATATSAAGSWATEGSARAATPDEVVEMGGCCTRRWRPGPPGFPPPTPPPTTTATTTRCPAGSPSPTSCWRWPTNSVGCNRGTITYLPRSAVGGLDAPDMDLLIELGRVSGLPVIIQGLGGRNKVDAPGAGWDVALEFLERARSAGSAVYSLLLARPFDRPFTLATGRRSTRGCRRGTGWSLRASHDRRALLARPGGPRRHALRGRAPEPRPRPRLDPAAAPLGRAVRRLGRGPEARRLRRPLDRSTSPPSGARRRPTPCSTWRWPTTSPPSSAG